MILGIYQDLPLYDILRWYTKHNRGVTDPSNAHWTRSKPHTKDKKGTFKTRSHSRDRGIFIPLQSYIKSNKYPFL